MQSVSNLVQRFNRGVFLILFWCLIIGLPVAALQYWWETFGPFTIGPIHFLAAPSVHGAPWYVCWVLSVFLFIGGGLLCVLILGLLHPDGHVLGLSMRVPLWLGLFLAAWGTLGALTHIFTLLIPYNMNFGNLRGFLADLSLILFGMVGILAAWMFSPSTQDRLAKFHSRVVNSRTS